MNIIRDSVFPTYKTREKKYNTSPSGVAFDDNTSCMQVYRPLLSVPQIGDCNKPTQTVTADQDQTKYVRLHEPESYLP